MSIYIDTSVLLLAASPAPPEAAVRVVRAIGSGAIDGMISVEVLQELLHGAAWRQARAQGLTLVDLVGTLFPHPRPVTAGTVAKAVDLLRRIPRLGIRVAIHAAAMGEAGVHEVIASDPDYGLVSGIRRLSLEDAVATWRL